MATITKRKTTKGFSFTAQIRINRPDFKHSEAKTFPKRSLAVAWAEKREEELAEGIIHLPLESLIRRYIKDFGKDFGRTKNMALEALADSPLAKRDAVTMTSQDIIQHVRERRKGCGPATALQDITWIGTVLRYARSILSAPVEPSIATEAREACRKLRLVSRGRKRDRTPTYEELVALDEYYSRQEARAELPMRYIMWFAIYSARRQSEICRLDPKDDDPERKMGLVRDLKHPDGAQGNDRRFRYTDEAWEIWQRFGPFHCNSKSVGTNFTRTCKILGIEDLRFHDLRHEATTRLFEKGLSIPEVATYTLHDSWRELQRYTNLVPGRRIFDAPLLNQDS